MKLPFLFAALLTLFTTACGTDPVQQSTNDSEAGDDDDPAGGGECSQFAGASSCPAGCALLQSDSANCGSCGNVCPAGSACLAGVCQAASCAVGTTQCGTGCVDTQSDTANCGDCGVTCPALTDCVSGGCMCSAGLTACNDACTDTTSDAANCGTCNNACGVQAPFCSNGTCTASCPAGTIACGNACVDTATSLQHCGMCNNVCAPGSACSAGVCGCGAGETLCGNACANLQTSTTSCGACGIACAVGQTCTAGVCTGGVATPPGACAAGQESCNGACVPAGTCAGGTGGAGPGTGGNGPTVVPSTGGTGNGGAGPTPTPSGDNPPGYWTSGDWHGCAWTGVDTRGVGSNITPTDFLSLAPGEPYCVSGVVGGDPDYESVALLGFNINEPNTVTCEYEEVTDSTPASPAGEAQASGIAVNFVKQGGDTAFTWRVQLQGPNGHLSGEAGAAERWCATITEVQGKVFIPYTDFNTECWDGGGADYNGEPISAISFLVPGAPEETPFDFCVNGFAYGTSAADAPDGSAVAGDQTGTVGGSDNDDLDFDRAKVLVGDEQYIIQNNNWGNPGGSDCILDYVNNSFQVTTCTGSNNPAPAAFPSIYIGNNGNTAQGVYSTSSTDSLPKQISAIDSLISTFRYSGGGGGSYNATYDIWFANSPPAGEYQDGIDGFIMIWLYDPSGAQPIGSSMGSAMIAGMNWNYWVGPRGDGPNGYNDAPVISYVNPSEGDNSRAQNFVDKNLKEFFTHAASLNAGITTSMYLTDVFAGFEIWNGGQGLKVDEYEAVVSP